MADRRDLRQEWVWNVTKSKEAVWLELASGRSKSGKKWGETGKPVMKAMLTCEGSSLGSE